MPCILKAKTDKSPGIITFTNNEVMSGVFNESSVQSFLNNESKQGRWIFGVHIQGQLSWVKKWPQSPWEDFFLWPEFSELTAMGIPEEKIIPMNCIQFMPTPPENTNLDKVYDLCIITRASAIKQIKEIIYILREIYDHKKNLKVSFIMPDPRKIELGDSCYEKQNIERDAFELPRKLFSGNELKKITFICSSTESFGNYPLGNELVYDLLAKSRFALSYSLMEGTPRTWIEALQVGTPVMINEKVQCGLFEPLNEKNTVYLKNNVKEAGQQVIQALQNYGQYSVDSKLINEKYGESFHREKLKKYLVEIIQKKGLPVEGQWYLDDLNFRLPCHGELYNGQIMNQSKFLFQWFNRINEIEDPTNESDTFGFIGFDDQRTFNPFISFDRLKTRVLRKMKERKLLKQPT